MTRDHYLKTILTVIALELLWLAVNGPARTASAQAAATPVIITGVQLDSTGEHTLPVSILGAVTIDSHIPLKVEADRPLKVETDRPLRVESVPYSPGKRPGE